MKLSTTLDINELSENMSRAALIEVLESLNAVWDTPEFWDTYWKVVKTLPEDTQVGIAAKLAKFGPHAKSESNFDNTKALPMDDTPEFQNNQVLDNCLDDLLEEAFDKVLSEKAAGIMRLYFKNIPVKDIAMAFKIAGSTTYMCIEESLPKLQEYVIKGSEWYEVYTQEVNRNPITFNTNITPVKDSIKRAREYVEEVLGCPTSYFITRTEQVSYNKLTLDHPLNKFVLDARQLQILAAALLYAGTHTDVKVYIKNSTNNYDTAHVSCEGFRMITRVKDGLIVLTKTKQVFKVTDDLIQVYPHPLSGVAKPSGSSPTEIGTN